MPSKWYYRIGDDKHGPIKSKALKLLAEVGQITPHTLVQKEGANSWAEASRVKGLFDSTETDTVTPPPVLANSVSAEPPIIPVATEYAHPITVDNLTAGSPHVVTPTIVTNPDGTQQSHKEFFEHKRRRRSPLPLLLTAVGIAAVAAFCIFEIGTQRENTTSDSNNPPVELHYPPRDLAGMQQQVFERIQSYDDASTSGIQLTSRKVQMRITDVWLTESDKSVIGETSSPGLTVNVLLETQNLDNSNEFTLYRESVVQTSTESLNPYTVLAKNGDAQILTSTQKLDNKKIPAGGKIVETLSFILESDRLDDFRLALPLAWFRKTGYKGYKIPDVMVAATPPTSIIARAPSGQTPETDNVTEKDTAGPIIGKVDSSSPKVKESTAPNENETKGSGQLPAPPDFGIPNQPEGKNGNQPEDINALQESIKSSVKPSEPGPETDGESQPIKPDEPKFK